MQVPALFQDFTSDLQRAEDETVHLTLVIKKSNTDPTRRQRGDYKWGKEPPQLIEHTSKSFSFCIPHLLFIKVKYNNAVFT